MASTGEKVSVFRRLGQILIGSRLITPEVLQEGLARAKSERRRLGETLTTMNAVSQDDVLRALAAQQGLPFLAADDLPSTLPLIKNLSPKYLRQYTPCPWTSCVTCSACASRPAWRRRRPSWTRSNAPTAPRPPCTRSSTAWGPR